MVDHVDVAVAWEADAEIFDFEKRWNVLGENQPVCPLQLDFSQLRERRLQRFSLFCVSADRINEKLVCFAVTCGLISLGSILRRSGHETVRKTLGEDVQRKNGEHDRQAWEECLPPTA